MKRIYPRKLISVPLRSLSRTGIWLGLAIAILVTVWQQVELRSARAWVTHTFEVLEYVQRERSLLVDFQSDLQSYLLRNDAAAQTQYEVTKASLLSELTALLRLTADNPLQQANLKAFQSLLKQEFEEQERLLKQQDFTNQIDRVELLEESQSKLDLQLLTKKLNEIEAVEKDLLARRRSTANYFGSATTATVLVGLFLAGFLSWLTNRERIKQIAKEQNLNARLESIELEQDLSNHLLTCRTKEEAYEILRSFFLYLLPNTSGAIFEINNSRDLLQSTVTIGKFPNLDPCSPRECWALRQGQILSGQRKMFTLPCQLCKSIHPEGTPPRMLCLPLQAHEQTIGILHLNDSQIEPDLITRIARHTTLPLAILQLQAELEHQTFKDSSTGLWNRRFMNASIQRIWARSKRLKYKSGVEHHVSIIFCDVDHFKAYNSEFGHEAGDLVLRTVARFLMETCRENDLPCRYGGEEFVIILPDTPLEGAKIKAERIRAGIKQLSAPGNRVITLSLGVAVYPNHGNSPDEVIKAANIAMLKAKAQGRDRTLVAS